MKSAHERYKDVRATIDRALEGIAADLAAMDERAEKKPVDWTFHGTALDVLRNLNDIRPMLQGRSVKRSSTPLLGELLKK